MTQITNTIFKYIHLFDIIILILVMDRQLKFIKLKKNFLLYHKKIKITFGF